MKQEKQKQNRFERKFYDFLEELSTQEKAIFVANTFKDKGKIMSIKIKRIDTPQEQMGDKGYTMSNSSSVAKKSDYVGMSESNQKHTPVGTCTLCINGMCNSNYNRGMLCNGINVTKGCPYKNGGNLAMVLCDKKNEIGNYVYLPDVLGLFRNRKYVGIKMAKRECIVQHLNKLKRYEIK